MTTLMTILYDRGAEFGNSQRVKKVIAEHSIYDGYVEIGVVHRALASAALVP